MCGAAHGFLFDAVGRHAFIAASHVAAKEHIVQIVAIRRHTGILIIMQMGYIKMGQPGFDVGNVMDQLDVGYVPALHQIILIVELGLVPVLMQIVDLTLAHSVERILIR